MATKHQTDSFRTVRNQKWMCEGDCFTRDEVNALKTKLIGGGRMVRVESHDGYWRVFASPEVMRS